jgi:hypothetical protein
MATDRLTPPSSQQIHPDARTQQSYRVATPVFREISNSRQSAAIFSPSRSRTTNLEWAGIEIEQALATYSPFYPQGVGSGSRLRPAGNNELIGNAHSEQSHGL